jgi:hypothetical protein
MWLIIHALFVITLSTLLASTAGAATLCPDGTWVGGNQCTLAPDGSYVGGNRAELAPDGSWVGNQRRGGVQIAPDGSFVGGRPQNLCPDGRWVTGRCELTPGGWVGE